MLQANPTYVPQDAPGLYSGLRLPGRGGGGAMGVRRRPQADSIDAPPQLQNENTPRQGDSLQTPNSEMVQQQDPQARAATGATPVAFEPQLDPMIQRIVMLANQDANLRDKMRDMESDPNYAPSRMRSVLSTIAGIGTGALTMNPMAGMAMHKNISEAPLRQAQQPIAQQLNENSKTEKTFGDISGLQATLAQRNAQMEDARAAGIAAQSGVQNAASNAINARTAAEKQKYDEAHPEVSTETYVRPGETTPSVNTVPKRTGTGQQPARLGGAKPEAGQFQVEASADGKSLVKVDKVSGTSTAIALPAGVQLNSQQVSDMAKYVNAYQKEHPGAKDTEAMDKYLSESRPNFGLETTAATRAAGDAETSRSEMLSARISGVVERLGAANDPTKAYDAYNRALEGWIKAHPEDAKVADKVRAAGKAKYPGAGRKETSSGYRLGDIKAQAEGKK